MSVSLSEQIAPQLPYLRRFARALTGSQERGDGYVAAMLEALIVDKSLFDLSLTPKCAAYKVPLRVWSALPLNDSDETAESRAEVIADRRIEGLTPLPRQAFLLAAVEKFETYEIASVLGRTEDEVIDLIDIASRELSEQLASRILIIEDEVLIAMELEALVADVGHEVAGVASTRQEAVSLARKTRPMMVLADVHLADGSSGIDAVNDILEEFNVPVIFITAYPESLLTGQRSEPAFLVTKPFRAEMLKAVIAQALFFDVKAGKPKAAVA